MAPVKLAALDVYPNEGGDTVRIMGHVMVDGVRRAIDYDAPVHLFALVIAQAQMAGALS